MESINLDKYIKDQIEHSCRVKQSILDDVDLLAKIKDVSLTFIETYKKGGKVLIAGNGGSAADAQHIAGELVNKFYFDRPGLPAISFTTDTSIMTAISNDYGFEHVFERQVQANGIPGDIFLGFSTSGNSKNILLALEACKRKGITTVTLTGGNGGKISGNSDYCIIVPSDETPRIQESHIMIGHIICSVVEKALFGSGI
jgi:D-sedoheptulose 7-phosphate isomerase